MNLFEDTYRTLIRPSAGEYRDRGSRFLAFAYPVRTEDEVKSRVKELKQEHHGARHWCYAFRLGADKQHFRANDDGEPSGTAGRPILGQIQSNDLTNVVVVVVRYFGGTLLGVPGLIQAYRSAAAEALKQAEIGEFTVNEVYELLFPYDQMNPIMKFIKDFKLRPEENEFGLDCRIVVRIRRNESEHLVNALKKLEKTEIRHLRTE